MEKIKIIFLGTSQAIPTATRNHTSILLSYKNENILIDCGEGTQRQFRKANINPCKITRLLITHWHGDHVLGIPGFFQTLALNNYSKMLHVYGPKGTKKFIKEILKIFIKKNRINVKVTEVDGKFFENNDFALESIGLEHGIPSNGYAFKEKDKLRINKDKLSKILKRNKLTFNDHKKFGNLIKGRNIKINKIILKSKDLTYTQKGRKLSFVFDTKYCKNAIKIAKNSDLSIIESTYSKNEKDLAEKYKHLTSGQAAQIAKEANVKLLVLTHISQRHEHKENGLLKEAKKIFPQTKIARDFMIVEV